MSRIGAAASAALVSCFFLSPHFSQAFAQEYAGPFVPHRGMQVTTTFHNDLGRDAHSTITVVAVTPDIVSLNSTSTRGIFTRRNVRIADCRPRHQPSRRVPAS